ncbi:MAG: lipoate--protein ligase [Lentisphaeria bacterium]
MHFYINLNTDPAFNLALEQTLCEGLDDFFMLWQNDNAVIIGRNQITAAELNADFIKEHHIKVVRRMTGGGAVYHDMGNINYTIGTTQRLLRPDAFQIHAEPILQALRELGVPAEFSGRNDLIADGKKFSGAARSVLKHNTLFHGTLLFDTNLSVLSQALCPDPDKIHAKGIKSTQSRVVNLKSYLPHYTTAQFIDKFSAIIQPYFKSTQIDKIPQEAIQKAELLAEKQYRTWNWNYGTQISYEYSKKKRFAGGSIRVQYSVKKNQISKIKFSGDFFGEKPIVELTEKFIGSAPNPEELSKNIAAINIKDYLHNITKEEMISLFQ